MTVRDDVIATTEAMAACINVGEDSVVRYLVAHGFSQLRAEVLTVFVPLGLARSVITRLPVNAPVKLPDRAIIRDSDGNEYGVRLCDVPEFVSALELGEETFRTGVIPREQFSSSCNSVEFNLINQMLFEGTEISGAVFPPSILLRLSEVPGFDEWYHDLSAN
jgi:hypothetical protein